jgi:hypothetical protein
MRDKLGRFVKGHHSSLKTEFKIGKTVGKNHPRWRGGRMINRGYVLVYRPQHPFAKNGKYVYEHRLVMEKHLGRYLKPGEVVHHKDKNKTNNKLCNLQLFSTNKEHISAELSGIKRPDQQIYKQINDFPLPRPEIEGVFISVVSRGYRVYEVKKCRHCGKMWWTRKAFKSKFCSAKCKGAQQCRR